MKGAIIAVGLWVMSVGISWGLLYYHSAERLRQATVFGMKQALSELQIEGIKTVRDFHLGMMDNADFIENRFDTNYLSRY